MDTTKAVANNLDVKLTTVPTMASTDAPNSALSVIYTNKGMVETYQFYNKNPDLISVDTRVIADALATWIEAKAVKQSHSQIFVDGQPTITADKHLNGIGFEAGGLAAAHSIHNGFTVIDGDIHHLTHGEKVAYGTITQLILENRPLIELDRYIKFYLQLGLPITLKDIHLENVTKEQLYKIAEVVIAEHETIHNMPFKMKPDDVVMALQGADAYVKHYKKCNGWKDD